MENTIISEGKSKEDAVKKGLEILKAQESDVVIELVEDKKTFFNILTSKKVQVRMTLKAKKVEEACIGEINKEEIIDCLNKFMKACLRKLPESVTYTVRLDGANLSIKMAGEELGVLIGSEGSTLYSMQEVISIMVNNVSNQRVFVNFDIEGYKEKKMKRVELNAQKAVEKVLKTGNSVKMRGLRANERRAIHNLLSEKPNIQTKSEGNEPNRYIIISYINS